MTGLRPRRARGGHARALRRPCRYPAHRLPLARFSLSLTSQSVLLGGFPPGRTEADGRRGRSWVPSMAPRGRRARPASYARLGGMPRLPFAHLPNAWLLLALVLQVLSYPFLDHYHGGRAVIAVFDLAIRALALRASRAGGHETRLGYVLVVPAMVLHAADALGGGA